ncbi:putative transmembrane two-component sensor kinase transcription regulator protein [Novosphingobium sp. Rr 2-17]|uniref:sensor histidine kinase n=1 Tax=Novosphingobium sp. Rr 2-17 TaxID=555793 RepID=UPI000269A490|nr:ATP-binding protein [Novosphingobium sp. Rr 2-17]EIZ80883.1 putative transmembrane two-component sensor kinase transcription regulator protein [Novosphingobium sp. Rr 2-17]
MRLAAPRSLLGQFIALHLAVALAAAIILFWSASALLHQTSGHFQRNLLRQQAALSIAAAGAGRPAPQVTILSGGMAVTTIGPDRRVQRSDGPSRPDILAAAPLDRAAHFFRRGAVQGYSVPAGDGWVVVSQDDADPAVVTDDIVRAFLLRFALICLPIAALAPLIVVLLARRLMLRMRAVSTIAATIGPRSLETRLPLGRLPLEAEPLAEATNAALDRLAAALRVQAAFAADVAHELRTPLAVIRLRADALADRDVRDPIIAAVDRAARVIAQLLALADLEQPLHEGGTPVDLHTLGERVVVDRAPAILASGRTISLERCGEAHLNGHPEALTLALENLIDNAARHTAPGTSIVVKTGPGRQISVNDDGVPIADASLAKLKHRLWRDAGADVEGTGIGLSIVERVANAHDGRLIVQRGAGGRGLNFILSMKDDITN